DAIRETEVPSATALLDHGDLEAIRKYAKVKPPDFPIEIFRQYKPIAEAAEEAGISENTMSKRVSRWFGRAILMNSNLFELAKDPLTEEQLNDVLENGAVFIALPIDGDGDWRWCPLHVEAQGLLPGRLGRNVSI